MNRRGAWGGWTGGWGPPPRVGWVCVCVVRGGGGDLPRHAESSTDADWSPPYRLTCKGAEADCALEAVIMELCGSGLTRPERMEPIYCPDYDTYTLVRRTLTGTRMRFAPPPMPDTAAPEEPPQVAAPAKTTSAPPFSEEAGLTARRAQAPASSSNAAASSSRATSAPPPRAKQPPAGPAPPPAGPAPPATTAAPAQAREPGSGGWRRRAPFFLYDPRARWGGIMEKRRGLVVHPQ